MKRMTRRTRWRGRGHETGIRERETAGKSSRRAGVTPARNSGRQERQSTAIGLVLVPVVVGEHYGPIPRH
jgi:hypothetical protein